jgi:small subunit ribosomal protein S21
MTVEIRPGETFESLLRRFGRAVNSGGILKEYRRRRWFVSKGEQRRMAMKKGIRRAKQRLRRSSESR